MPACFGCVSLSGHPRLQALPSSGPCHAEANMAPRGDSKAKKGNRTAAARAVNVAREAALAFLEADGDADGKLSFLEVVTNAAPH